MSIVMRPSCWHKIFGFNGLSAPTLGLCLNFFSSITADFTISSALRWAIQYQWSSGVCIWFEDFVNASFWRLWMCNVIIEPRHDKTNKVTVRPTKTQISLGIRPVLSESSPWGQWVAKDPSFLHAVSEDSDQTGWMPRLIWVFAGCTVILLVLSWGGSFHGSL